MGIRVSVLGLALSCDGCRKPPHPWGQRISGELLELQVSPPPRGESVSPGISSLGKNLPPRLMAGLHTSWRCFFPVDVWLSILLELRFWLLVGWFFCGSYHGKSHFLIHFFGRMCFSCSSILSKIWACWWLQHPWQQDLEVPCFCYPEILVSNYQDFYPSSTQMFFLYIYLIFTYKKIT